MNGGIRRLGFFLALLSAAASATPRRPAAAPTDATPLRFVQNYLTQLSAFETLREEAARDLEADKAHAPIVCIHSGTRFDLEIGASIRLLRSTHLVGVDKQLAQVPQMFAALYSQRQKTMAEITTVCSAFAKGPKPGVDYADLASRMPELRAKLEHLDQTALRASPLVFGTLISDVPDSKGHASHLVISCDERKRLVDQIDTSFGAKLGAKDAATDVIQAQILRAKLLEFKCAEQPR